MTESPLFDLRNQRVFVAGHRGMAGSAILRRLAREQCHILTMDHADLDLTRQSDTERWLIGTKPDAVILAAAKVGGIHANSAYPYDFLLNNLAIAQNVIEGSLSAGVKKLLFLGSSCIYPRLAPQPMTEDMLLTGPLEPTNRWYAIAKIAGVMLCQAARIQHRADFISVMPTNIYGPGDNYHPIESHVPAALIRRIHEAKVDGLPTVTVWGSGGPRREFIYVDDFADACIHIMKRYSDIAPINVGTGTDLTIREFAELIRNIVGYHGALAFDTSRPDGTPQKLLDVTKLSKLGWRAQTNLREGLTAAYADFLASGRNVPLQVGT